MKTSDFDYHLPPALIAATPAPRRDQSRLLVLDRATGVCEEARFAEIGRWLRPGDLLVANDSRVIPARLTGHRHGTGGKAEALLLAPESETGWLCLCRPAAKLRPGTRLVFGDGRLRGEVLAHRGRGERLIQFHWEGDWWGLLDEIGEVPLPPYIAGARRDQPDDESLARLDRERYQTVYAAARGSVAAPTAGLHFTQELIASLQAQGAGWATVTLHVGLGTFRPVEAEDIESHVMHGEHFTLSEEAAQSINATRDAGGRVIAVGTTATRVLESCAAETGRVQAQSGATRIFITPGHRFRAVDGLITNFHLPRSTLLMLVCALAGREHTLAAYQWAIERRFRFYSYGDAMLIVNRES
ncbi:MAG: tRNA preQ1(34) S-adenosylmethionine ribosyltransferase-isomerase QueA [Candidatus Sumerlaeia bacterium]|nr:tRNA preQ1(34) S-adenosylmethionine ribosyltransferase-isomerase QueA [Candidatus Sumerlaeia bacterium]